MIDESVDVFFVEMTPWKINGWNRKITNLNRKIIFQTIIFRFDFNLRGCIFFCGAFSTGVARGIVLVSPSLCGSQPTLNGLAAKSDSLKNCF